jgi:site-specific DNA-methyltransferase (adenine-specific)/modification methylase
MLSGAGMRREILADGVELYLGDMLSILPTLGEFDACVTDPPYGIGIAANPVRQAHEKLDWDNAPPPASAFDLIRAKARYLIIWGGNYFDLPPSQGFLVWDKVQPENFSLAMCEQAWTNIQRPAKMFKRHVVSFKKEHPTQKPDELMEWCIDQLPADVGTVLDPYMGSGSTGCAAVKKGKAFYGIEREPKYFDIAVRRIEDALKRPDLFIPAPQPKPKQESLI